MQITVNGELREVSAHTLLEYLNDQGLQGRRIAVERNGVIVPKSQMGAVDLEEGDVLEIVQAIGGG